MYFCSPDVRNVRGKQIFKKQHNLFSLMEEGKDKIAISCGDILTLSQVMSSLEVKYARLEMKYERLEEDNISLKAQLAKSESNNLDQSAENRTLKETVLLQQEEIHSLKAKLNDRADASPMSDQEMAQKAIVLILEKYLLLSIEKVKDTVTSLHLNKKKNGRLLRVSRFSLVKSINNFLQ